MSFTPMTPERSRTTITSLFKYEDRVDVLYAADSILAEDYPEEVFARLRSPIPIHLEMNVHSFERDRLRILSKAGVQIVEAGIEALATKSLRLMRKGTTASQNLMFLRDCLLNDILATWNYLIGLPGEDEKIYEKLYHDIPCLTHFPPAGPTAVTFERFSEYHTNPEKYGLKLKPHRFYELTYPFPWPDIVNLAYNFVDHGNGHFQSALKKWIPRLQERFRVWNQLWEPSRGETIPALYVRKYGADIILVDSRSGSAREYPLSPAGLQLLTQLNRPRRLADLRKKNPRMDIDLEFDRLLEGRLLFQDENRWLSLVFPSKPEIPTYLKNHL